MTSFDDELYYEDDDHLVEEYDTCYYCGVDLEKDEFDVCEDCLAVEELNELFDMMESNP